MINDIWYLHHKRYTILYDMIWYDMKWYDKIYFIRCRSVWIDMNWDDMTFTWLDLTWCICVSLMIYCSMVPGHCDKILLEHDDAPIHRTAVFHRTVWYDLGGGNSNIFLMFTPKMGEDEPILTIIFFKGVCSTTNKNRGTPKWMVYNGKPYWNGWFGGTTNFGNTHIASFIDGRNPAPPWMYKTP